MPVPSEKKREKAKDELNDDPCPRKPLLEQNKHLMFAD